MSRGVAKNSATIGLDHSQNLPHPMLHVQNGDSMSNEAPSSRCCMCICILREPPFPHAYSGIPSHISILISQLPALSPHSPSPPRAGASLPLSASSKWSRETKEPLSSVPRIPHPLSQQGELDEAVEGAPQGSLGHALAGTLACCRYRSR
jgi:hypothetical protein